MSRLHRFVLGFLCFLGPGVVTAHSLNDSYLDLGLDASEVTATLRVAIADLELAVGLDSNRDAIVTWREVNQARPAIDNYLHSRLQLQLDNSPCALEPGAYLMEELPGGSYLLVPLSGTCIANSGALTLSYSLMFDLDNSHRGVALLSHNGRQTSYVFSPDNMSLLLDQHSPVLLTTLATYVREGVWHIWIGIDHILFLLAMLLGVVVHQQKLRAKEEERKEISVEILKLVTAFTVAHSITLALATFEIVSLPAALVESAIAVTVVIGGINIVYPLFGKRHWQFAFGFGLIHGFGFANVLAELSLSMQLFFISLLGFNVGVEIGQLAIVLALIPLLYLVNSGRRIREFSAAFTGLLICQVGLIWFVERSF